MEIKKVFGYYVVPEGKMDTMLFWLELLDKYREQAKKEMGIQSNEEDT